MLGRIVGRGGGDEHVSEARSAGAGREAWWLTMGLCRVCGADDGVGGCERWVGTAAEAHLDALTSSMSGV